MRWRSHSDLFIQVDKNEITVIRSRVEAANLRVWFQGASPVLEPLGPSGCGLQVNGVPLSGSAPVLLGDAIRFQGRPLDLRKLRQRHLQDQFTFDSEGAVSTISSFPEADFHVPDACEQRWECRLAGETAGYA